MISAKKNFALAAMLAVAPLMADVPAGYPGAAYQGKVQEIPGRVFLSDFDQGPKDKVWHDFQTKNPWACKVRDSTGVGMQLMGQGGDKGDTKEADSLVKIRMGKCYLAETNQGDWTKYTVRVKQAGAYTLSMLTAASETQIPFVGVSLLTDKDSAGTGKIVLPITTYFHHWVYTRSLATMNLDSGTQVLRFDIVGNGPMNIDYIDFGYAGAAAVAPRLAGATETGLPIRGIHRDAAGLHVAYAAPSGGPVSIRVYNASGAVLARSQSLARAAGPTEAVLAMPVARPGMLFVEIRSAGLAVVRAWVQP